MLICNYSYINQICGHNHSGITNPVWIIAPHRMRGYYGSAQTDANAEQTKRDSFPTGTNPPYTIMMGPKGSLLSSTTTISSTSTLSGGIAMGRAIAATIEGTSSVTAGMGLITQLAAALLGTGTLTASMVGTIQMAATLAGSGDLTGAVGLIANITATLTGTGSVTGNLRGTASMEATIYVNQSEATSEQIAAAVWNALAAVYNNPGTMGELLNGAGGGSSPSQVADAVWDELLSGHVISGSAGKKLKDALKTGDFIALK